MCGVLSVKEVCEECAYSCRRSELIKCLLWLNLIIIDSNFPLVFYRNRCRVWSCCLFGVFCELCLFRRDWTRRRVANRTFLAGTVFWMIVSCYWDSCWRTCRLPGFQSCRNLLWGKRAATNYERIVFFLKCPSV